MPTPTNTNTQYIRRASAHPTFGGGLPVNFWKPLPPWLGLYQFSPFFNPCPFLFYLPNFLSFNFYHLTLKWTYKLISQREHMKISLVIHNNYLNLTLKILNSKSTLDGVTKFNEFKYCIICIQPHKMP